jgi:hypothetical protein
MHLEKTTPHRLSLDLADNPTNIFSSSLFRPAALFSLTFFRPGLSAVL